MVRANISILSKGGLNMSYSIYSQNWEVKMGTKQLVTYVKTHSQALKKVDELSALNPETYYYEVKN